MKRIVALIVCMCLLPIFPAASYGAESSIGTQSTEYTEAVETLAALKVLEGDDEGNLMLDKVLTRAEFVTILVRLLNTDFGSSGVYFEDVPADHWAASAIGTVSALGIVQGIDETHFAPEAPLAIEEAVKMLVTVLGYEPMAKGKGGYPNGYMAVAHDLRLLRRVESSPGIIVKRASTAELIFNALEAEIVIEEAYTNGEVSASIYENSSLLHEKMKIRKGSGIVTANEVTSLSKSGGLSEGKVKIGNKIFSAEQTGAENLLGYTVTYYSDCSEHEDIEPLLYVRVAENKNETITIYSRDIQPSSNITEMVYAQNGKTRTKKISTLADIMYNGMGTGGTHTDVIPESGYVTLVDNNCDNLADVVLVYDFTTFVADTVSVVTNIAYDSKDASKFVQLDPESDEYVFAIFENGVRTDFNSIRAGSTLSVAKSTNTSGKKQITVLVSNKSDTGVISAIGDSEAVINEETYHIMNGLETTLKKLLGKETVFYINAFGEIAGTDKETESSFEYGYLIAYGTSGTLSKKTELKILTERGKVEIFTAKKEISLDGKTKEKAESAITQLSATERNDSWASSREDYASGAYKVKGQLIRYRTNSKGEVTAIDTTAPGSGGDGDTLTPVTDEGFPRPNNFRHNAGGFGNRDKNFVIDGNTKVFLVPAGDAMNDDSYYGATNNTYFSGVQWFENKIECYDMSDSMCMGAMIVDAVTRANADVPTYNPIFPVEKISVITDVDGTETYKITGTVNNMEKSYVLLDKDVLNYNVLVRNPSVLDATVSVTKTVKVGDMIQCGANSDGRVIRILGFVPGMTDSTEIAPMGFVAYGQDLLRAHAGLGAVIGRLTVMDGLNIVVDTLETSVYKSAFPFALTPSTPVSIYNVADRKNSSCTVDELVKHVNNVNSRVAVVTKFGAISEVIIYNFE
ncbi:MAG: S-layer homology domain-containing protein [Ruminococcaceae bacterium]|nr:S-layer homology domain-containing protein [Oscillospiraceae bacterium]